MACAPKNFTCFGSTQPKMSQFAERLGDFTDQRATSHRDDHVVWQFPAKLLGNFVAVRLGAFGVIGTEIHVDQSPLENGLPLACTGG